MKNHRDEYIEVRDGAITYCMKDDLKDDIINDYLKTKDTNKRMQIVTLINQKNERKKLFLDSLEEFDKIIKSKTT